MPNAFTSPSIAANLRLMRVLAALLLVVAWVLPAGAEVRDYPRDPDFYFPFDSDKHDSTPVKRPDLATRPKPRDARTLSGVFAPDPVGTLRMMGVKESTSLCIGAPVTALCAVETFFAAWIRRDDALRKLAMGPYWDRPYFTGSLSPPPPQEPYFIYKVLSVEAARPFEEWQRAKWWRGYILKGDSRGWRDGDILIDILEMQCRSKSEQFCNSRLTPLTYVVRRVDAGHWAVVDVYVPRW